MAGGGRPGGICDGQCVGALAVGDSVEARRRPLPTRVVVDPRSAYLARAGRSRLRCPAASPGTRRSSGSRRLSQPILAGSGSRAMVQRRTRILLSLALLRRRKRVERRYSLVLAAPSGPLAPAEGRTAVVHLAATHDWDDASLGWNLDDLPHRPGAFTRRLDRPDVFGANLDRPAVLLRLSSKASRTISPPGLGAEGFEHPRAAADAARVCPV